MPERLAAKTEALIREAEELQKAKIVGSYIDAARASLRDGAGAVSIEAWSA